MDGGKLSEVNARTESRRQNELVGKFKMAASDFVSVRGQVMEYTYIPTGDHEIWCGLPLEGASHRDCWKKTGGHLF